MSVDHDQDSGTNEDVIRRMLAAGDKGDWSVVERIWSPDIVVHFGATDLARPEALALLRSAYAAFPDMRHDVHDLIAIDDRVVLRGKITATHRGEFQGIPATGKEVTIGQIVIFRVADGRIVEYWEQADFLGLMQQLGAVPGGDGSA
jgi:steroid delta-isomerase-like uncharacterized protein